jgi:hypothetical protein
VELEPYEIFEGTVHDRIDFDPILIQIFLKATMKNLYIFLAIAGKKVQRLLSNPKRKFIYTKIYTIINTTNNLYPF